MTNRIETLAHALVKAARAAGADAADALVVEGHSLTVDVRRGALEQAERSEGTDLGIRVFIGRRQACVSSSDADPSTFPEIAARAVAMAREAPEDPFAGLAAASEVCDGSGAGVLDLLDPVGEPAASRLKELALTAEASAMAVQGVSQVQGASASWGVTQVHLAASNGFSGGYARSSSALSTVAISGEGLGMEREHCVEARVHAADLPDAETVGRTAGERAAARAGTRRPPTGRFPVIFDERISASLMSHLVAAANGSAVARGSSWLLDALGQPVLPAHMTLTEDPHRARISASRPFDAEGLPTQARNIVDAGVLTGWTLDLGTARKLGLASTANAARGTAGPPSPSVTGVTLSPGDCTLDELLRDIGEGLLVTGLIGSTINPNTGDYSRGASGFWIEGGERAYPVNECTIAGNLRDMLRGLVAANDARDHASWRVPSLAVDGLTIAGN